MNHQPKPEAFTTAPTRFVVIADFKNLGRSIINDPEDTRRMVVDFIASGEWQHVVTVLEVLPEGRWNDVTEDVAREVRDLCHHEQREVSWQLRNWIQVRLDDVMATRGLREVA